MAPAPSGGGGGGGGGGGTLWGLPYTTYRWAVVLPMTVVVSVMALGSIFAYSEFVAFVGAARPAWSRSVVQTSLSIQGCMGGVVPFLVGAHLQHHLRAYAVAGVVLLSGGIGLGGVAVAHDLVGLYYVGVGLVQGVGYGCLYIATLQHLMKWFPDVPGLVAGLLGLFLGVGAMLFTNVNFQLCSGRGPARALLIVAFLALVCAGPCCACFAWPPSDFKPPPNKRKLALGGSASSASASASSASSPAGGQGSGNGSGGRYDSFEARTYRPLSRADVLRTRQFWLICGVVFVTLSPGWGLVSVYTPMFQRLMPHTAAYGDSDTPDGDGDAAARHALATHYTTVANLAYTLGRLAWGALSDVLGNKPCYYLFLVCQSALFALLPLLQQHAPFGAFLGALCTICTLYGGSKVLLAPTVAEYLRPENANTGVGMSLIAIAGAALTGPTVVSWLTHGNNTPTSVDGHDPARMYDTFFWSMSALTATGLVLLVPLQLLERGHAYDEVPLHTLESVSLKDDGGAAAEGRGGASGGGDANASLVDSAVDDADGADTDTGAGNNGAGNGDPMVTGAGHGASNAAAPNEWHAALAAIDADPTTATQQQQQQQRARIVELSGFSPSASPARVVPVPAALRDVTPAQMDPFAALNSRAALVGRDGASAGGGASFRPMAIAPPPSATAPAHHHHHAAGGDDVPALPTPRSRDQNDAL